MGNAFPRNLNNSNFDCVGLTSKVLDAEMNLFVGQ